MYIFIIKHFFGFVNHLYRNCPYLLAFLIDMFVVVVVAVVVVILFVGLDIDNRQTV